MIKKIFIVLLGFFLRVFQRALGVKKNYWVFGSSSGEAFLDNSKYFFEFVNQNHKNINTVWITRSKKVIDMLKRRGFNAYHNLSIKGIYYVLRSGVAVFCTSRNDLWFVYPKAGRKIVNLWHGMPMKKIVFDYEKHKPENRGFKDRLWEKYVVGFKHQDVSLITATSGFFKNILKSAFRNDNVYVTGQPRTDVFFCWDKKSIKNKLGFPDDSKVITYMPTHRDYGKGELNPRIFEHNDKAKEFFIKNNTIIVWKFHKNMLSHYNLSSNNAPAKPFIDLTNKNIDPQELLFVTDILITDYSSCYIDYLLLNRPVIFYHYDNYVTDDNELYFKPEDHKVGNIVFNERELLDIISTPTISSNSIISYHDKEDGNSSRRVFDLIIML